MQFRALGRQQFGIGEFQVAPRHLAFARIQLRHAQASRSARPRSQDQGRRVNQAGQGEQPVGQQFGFIRHSLAVDRIVASPASIRRMLALIQRVTQATVSVDGQAVGAIGPGLLALVAVEPGDGEAQFARMAERLLGYRVFADEAGKMNRSLADTGGGLLLVSQFTLAADTRSGMRPSFTTAAPPDEAERGFNRLVAICRRKASARGWKPGVSVPIWWSAWSMTAR